MVTTFLTKMTSVSQGPVFFYHHVHSNMLLLNIYKEVTCSISLFPKDSNGPIKITEIPAFSTAASCYVKEIAKVFSKFRDPQMVNNNVDK